MNHKFWGSVLGRSVLSTGVLDGVASIGLALAGRTQWILGVWLSAAWFLANSYMMWHIMEAVGSGQRPDQRRILGWCVVKFPILYLAGLGILMIPGVESNGVLITFTFFLMSLGLVQVIGSFSTGKRP